ncbi:hypothetical protein ACU4GA_15765 [Methylobacterium oryzae CBMB20]
MEGRSRAGTTTLRARVRGALVPILAASCAGAVAACALAEPLVRLAFGPGFGGAVPVLRIATGMSVLLIAATVLFAGPSSRWAGLGFAVRGSAAACATNLIACALLIPWDPLLGAGLAALLAEAAMLLVLASRLLAGGRTARGSGRRADRSRAGPPHRPRLGGRSRRAGARDSARRRDPLGRPRGVAVPAPRPDRSLDLPLPDASS